MDPDAILCGLRRVLKTDGRLTVSDHHMKASAIVAVVARQGSAETPPGGVCGSNALPQTALSVGGFAALPQTALSVARGGGFRLVSKGRPGGKAAFLFAPSVEARER